MLKAIDFFCGAGGLTRGLLDVGIDVLAGVDNDSTLRDTYAKNNAPSRFVNKSVRAIDIIQLRADLGITPKDQVLYAACTPCQPFSTLNQRQGRDRRKSLLLTFARLIEEAPPDLILVENVPGLNTAYGRTIYARFIKVLNRLGFAHRFERMLDAQHYGVPQIRKRFIMLASRVGPISSPRATRNGPTVYAAIRRFPRIRDGQKHPSIHDHEARPLVPHHKRLICSVPRNGGSRCDVTDQSLLLKCHRDQPKVHKDVFGRMAWDGPAPTLTCRCIDVYCGRFVHPSQSRGISVREAAALQTFPDDYQFHADSLFQKSRQIGNAVPVELARRLGRAALRSLRA